MPNRVLLEQAGVYSEHGQFTKSECNDREMPDWRCDIMLESADSVLRLRITSRRLNRTFRSFTNVGDTYSLD